MPVRLKEMKGQLQQLTADEEAAWAAHDYEHAAEYKTERVRLEQEYNGAVEGWRAEVGLDDIVDARGIAAVVRVDRHPRQQHAAAGTEKLLNMEDLLRLRIVGQEQAIVAVSDAIRRARSGLKDPKRPIGTFLFLGPTGVGKTELAKALAGFMFDDDDALLRIDMSEYCEPHTVSRLFGAPPGYVGYNQGGHLTEQVRRRPCRVILFDEVEKAHQDVWNSLLQIMDDGRLTDGQGRNVDFRNTVVIMTSNVGADSDQARAAGLRHALVRREQIYPVGICRPTQAAVPARVLEPHRRDHRLRDADPAADPPNREAAHEGYRPAHGPAELHRGVTDAAADYIAEVGYDPAYGARPLRRLLQRQVENRLSKRLLRGEYQTGDHVRVDYDRGAG